jgi:probable HAF family extracellular repeat protein
MLGVASNQSHAFLWSAELGIRDLNDLSVAEKPGWVLIDARSINNSGQIVGVGTVNGQIHAFLLTPRF